MYEHRTYRNYNPDQRLVAFHVVVQETDLYIKARKPLEATALQFVRKARVYIEEYSKTHPGFYKMLTPLPVDQKAPVIVNQMLEAASAAGVGPMAAVAGAISEYVGTKLLALSTEVLIENGGDLFLATEESVTIDVFAGPSPLSQKVGILFHPPQMPLGVCTSSGSVGPSLSFGKADAVTVVSPDTALADAMATAIANTIHSSADIEAGLQRVKTTPGLLGALIIIGDQMGVWGDIELVMI